jgi:Replication protein
MADAILSLGDAGARWLRFVTCGRYGRVESDLSTRRFRVRYLTCHDRFCEPCGLTRGWAVQPRLLQLMGTGLNRSVCLTLEGDVRPLRELLLFLRESFSRLRETKFWLRSVAGGAWFVEVTRGASEDHWHVHVHSIVQGTWIDKFELSDVWRTATGGSYIVHVRSVDDNEDGAWYASKYCSKGVSRGAVRSLPHLREALRAFSGRRLLATFGNWHGVQLDEDDREESGAIDHGDVASLASRALHGDLWAIGVLRQLHAQVQLRDGHPLFTYYDPSR